MGRLTPTSIIIQALNLKSVGNLKDDLEKHEYISVHHAGDDIRRPRYVKLNYDKLLKALGIKRCIKGCIKGCINAGANEGLNVPTNNLAQNKITNYQITRRALLWRNKFSRL